MAQNEYKPKEPLAEEQTAAPEVKSKPGQHKSLRLTSILRSIIDGTVLTRAAVVKLLPFGLFLALLVVLYIGNSYNSEKVIKKSNKIRNDLIELQYEYISTKSDLMHASKLSELSKMLDSLHTNIKASTVPPVKIYESVEPKQQKQ